jgi:hypothetical protein
MKSFTYKWHIKCDIKLEITHTFFEWAKGWKNPRHSTNDAIYTMFQLFLPVTKVGIIDGLYMYSKNSQNSVFILPLSCFFKAWNKMGKDYNIILFVLCLYNKVILFLQSLNCKIDVNVIPPIVKKILTVCVICMFRNEIYRTGLLSILAFVQHIYIFYLKSLLYSKMHIKTIIHVALANVQA